MSDGPVIDQDGREQEWTAVYWRHHAREKYEAESLSEAIGFLFTGEEHEDLVAEAVLGPDGDVVMDEAAIRRAFDARSSRTWPPSVTQW